MGHDTITFRVSVATLKSAIVHAATDSTRFQLHSVYFSPAGDVVATDGKRLFIGATEHLETGEKVGLPPGVLVELDDIKAVIKGARKDESVEVSVPIMADLPGESPIRDEARRDIALSRGVMSVSTKPIEGNFPPYEKAMPKGDGFKISMNPKYLQQICAEFTKACPKEKFSVVLELVDNKSAMRIHGPTGLSVVMPLVTDAPVDSAVDCTICEYCRPAKVAS